MTLDKSRKLAQVTLFLYYDVTIFRDPFCFWAICPVHISRLACRSRDASRMSKNNDVMCFSREFQFQ